MSLADVKLKIDGEEIDNIVSVEVSERINQFRSWEAEVVSDEAFARFLKAEIEDKGVEVFQGRIEEPEVVYSMAGPRKTLRGYGWEARLNDSRTGSNSVTDETLANTLDMILEESPWAVGDLATLYTIREAFDLSTSLEFLQFMFSGTHITYHVAGVEISDMTRIGTIDLPVDGNNASFFYDGNTKRFYCFYLEAGTIYYEHSEDGDTWTRVNSGATSASDYWSVDWHGSKVYLFIDDGVRVDVYRGTINDGTGAITFALVKDNAAGGDLVFGPFWDDDDHIWIAVRNGDCDLYESTDDGASWNNRFTTSMDFMGFVPKMNGSGDLWILEYDDPNDDVEMWEWIAGTSTEQYVELIGNEVFGTVIECVDGACGYNQRAAFVYENNQDEVWLVYYDGSSWDVDRITDSGDPNTLTISLDKGTMAYVGMAGAWGLITYRYNEVTEIENSGNISTYGTPNRVHSVRAAVQGGIVGIFWTIDDTGDDHWFRLNPPLCIRLDDGETTGYFQTDDQAGDGDFEKWGYLNAEGGSLPDTEWSIYDSGGSNLLIDGLGVPVDLEYAGLEPGDTPIQIRCDLDNTGATDPYIEIIYFSERWSKVSFFEVEYEYCYDALTRLMAVLGGEISFQDDDTLDIVERLGSDKSGVIILKTADTPLYPDVKPNIENLTRLEDNSTWANCVLLVGGGVWTPVVESKDYSSIAEMAAAEGGSHNGEHWWIERDDDMKTEAMANTRATIILENRMQDPYRFTVDFIEECDVGDIQLGDTVTVVNGYYGINSSYRIVELTRRWTQEGKRISAELVNRSKIEAFMAKVGEIDKLNRTKYSI
jgi:hypothetical protein